MLYTAQYRYSGPDRLDITAKSKDPVGKLFAPTWDMIKDLKAGKITEKQYRAMYHVILMSRWEHYGLELTEISNKAKYQDLTLVCFCPSDAFCHRYLLMELLTYNWRITYGGER